MGMDPGYDVYHIELQYVPNTLSDVKEKMKIAQDWKI